MNIIQMEHSQFSEDIRKIDKQKMRKILGKPKHRGDITACAATFWGNVEDKESQHCMN